MKYTSSKKTPTAHVLWVNEVDASVLARPLPWSCDLAANIFSAKVWKETSLCQKAQGGQFHLAARAASLINGVRWRNRGKRTQGVAGDTFQSHPDHHILSKSSVELGNG